ncbi:hypothetical protein K505DRAFT_279309 [Melanomma pulvis-pyrius CBS 109.77]|uniref:Xylanolytic transcriptional activator regulatory domain-containing protein n=1 Tax=Melanomma pulvis-pyrius CBS 109.77 TaxID=1314802 RepID=A0A6A6X7U9_9PLEO|nr:hypothetical protein K505DRAFT_279309 [Melanomma pulvis-pyrius CBS 109.77]
MLYAQIAEDGIDQPHQPITDASRSMFLGEAFSLTYVIQDVLAPFLVTSPYYQRRLHFPLASQGHGSVQPSLSTTDIILQQDAYLKKQDLSFKVPEQTTNRLLAAFFRDFQPAFPILDPAEFLPAVAAEKESLLVLNAILMIAVTICDDETLHVARFTNRYAARSIFYHQAKALYDADREPDKVNNIVGVFFMSFWWGGPDDQKDSWHWLAVATSLAQSMGMHRSTKNSGMDKGTASLWRRIWWSIRVRDALVSGSIGRPQHMSDCDCDVEILSIDDVLEVMKGYNQEQIAYSCQMAEMSTIFSKIITTRYGSSINSPTSANRINLEQRLDQFRDILPASLRYNGVRTTIDGLWPAMLSMAFNYATILLCRPPRSINGREETDMWGNSQKAFAAAKEVTRVMDDILTSSVGRFCQIHTIPALFNALAIHVFTICTSRPVGRELAENRARICMLGLATLQESWPVGGWVLRLFVSVLERLKSRLAQETQSRPASSEHLVASSTQPLQPAFENSCTSHHEESQTRPLPSSSWDDRHMTDLQMSLQREAETMAVRHLVPDIFSFGDVSEGAVFDQENFFEMLNVPTWNIFET